jgi:hypothetical protein
MKHGRPIIDLKGQTFGDLTVLDECGRKRKSTLFRVICICVTVEERSSAELRHEGKKRCQNCSRHGLCQTPEYKSWAGMKNRCTNPRNHEYKNYGARGITVCEEWSATHGFLKFLEDMGPCPPGRTLNRIDNDGPYCKANCEWATRKQQTRIGARPS